MTKGILAAILVLTGAVIAIAQADPISTRKALMKENDQNAVIVVRMLRGMAPFDAAKVDAAFAQWADTAKRLPALFPDSSKTGQQTRAASKIWLTKADFDAKAADFGKVVGENRERARASLDGLRAAIPAVGKTCDACHRDYRLSRQ
jgi:cytochrome c556